MNKEPIRLLIMDVDGTLTDGSIIYDNNGDEIKSFNVKDGYGIVLIKTKNIIPIIITGRSSKANEYRAKDLGIEEFYQNVSNKTSIVDDILKKYRFSWQNVAYIGDDINDLDCIQKAGLSACPADAIEKIKKCCTTYM